MTKETETMFYQILREELIEAQGCTEPIAIAYAAARAGKELGEEPERMTLLVSGNMVKNAMGVVVPNSGGRRGCDVAAILGAIAGSDALSLEVLQHVTEADVRRMAELKDAGFCETVLVEEEEPLYISVRLQGRNHSSRVDIRHYHTNICYVSRDDEVLLDNTKRAEETETFQHKAELSFDSILEFARTADWHLLKEIMEPQVRLNTAIAEEGLRGHYGAEVGRTILETGPDCVRVRALAKAAAGSDARMGGCTLPVVINSGSGNQGITVSVAVYEYAKELEAGEEKLYRALAISNLMSIHIKKRIGALSAFCGAVSAAAGAGAGITYLLGGDSKAIGRTLVNALGNDCGIICDGAKSSCAAKIYSALSAGLLAAQMSLKGRVFQPGEGIVKDEIEKTIASVGHIGKDGMRSTDSVVLGIMLGREPA
ncbi:MAG: serine dehydratase subunit alpha family protein [Lachnospiraceae bacterium]|nr:serine dehydratase subunit alpha family protein [Lachnospiraceae bacterium]